MGETIRLSGHISEEQVRRSPFLYLPFRVPPGARRIHVAYDYSEPVTAPFGMGPGSVVDIGIFDSRGHDFVDAPGFRGWSGTSKKEFFITAAGRHAGIHPRPALPWRVEPHPRRRPRRPLRCAVRRGGDLGRGRWGESGWKPDPRIGIIFRGVRFGT